VAAAHSGLEGVGREGGRHESHQHWAVRRDVIDLNGALRNLGQYRLGRRLARLRQGRGIGQSIVAPCYKDSELARIVLTRDQLIKKGIGLGIYSVEVTDGNKSIRFIRELREVENPQEIYVIIPKLLSDAFKNRQRVQVTLTKLNLDKFYQMVKNPLTRKYNLGRIEMKDDKLSMQIGGKELEFNIYNYAYQQKYDYTGAYIECEGPLPNKQSFKILYDGFKEPYFLFLEWRDRYRKIQNVSYDQELQCLYVAYKYGKERESTKIIRLGEQIKSIELKIQFERYFQAKSKGLRNDMGAAGTAIVVEILKDMGYKVIWADTIKGNTKGPDISLFDGDGKTITAEAKSTSIFNGIDFALNDAINDLEKHYFDHNNPNKKFLWHTEDNNLRYEADYALAVAIYLDKSNETVDTKMRRIDVGTSEGKIKFNRTTLTWRTEHIG